MPAKVAAGCWQVRNALLCSNSRDLPTSQHDETEFQSGSGSVSSDIFYSSIAYKDPWSKTLIFPYTVFKYLIYNTSIMQADDLGGVQRQVGVEAIF